VADIEVTKGDKKEKFAVGTVHLESHRPSGRFRAIQLKLTFPFIKSLVSLSTRIFCLLKYCASIYMDGVLVGANIDSLW